MVIRRIPLKQRRARLHVEDGGKVIKACNLFSLINNIFNIGELNTIVVNLLLCAEPLSKLLKNAKQNAANSDGEKVSDNQIIVVFC